VRAGSWVGGTEVTALDRESVEGRLRDIQSITDTALSRLDERELLAELLDRVRDILQADTAAVLLLDSASRQLIARSARVCASRSAGASRGGSPPRPGR
jgi:hypothetical protein